MDSLLRQEWLLTDGFGHFAMGTAAGARTRKYHSMLAGLAGREETNYLAGFDLECQGAGLWTQIYRGQIEPVYHPDGHRFLREFGSTPWPRWIWALAEGLFAATLRNHAAKPGSFELELEWLGSRGATVRLRPFWAMRPLHGLGGQAVSTVLERGKLWFNRVGTKGPQVWLHADTPFEWEPAEDWYRDFFYPEERARGYAAQEDLFTSGSAALTLKPGRRAVISFGVNPPAAKIRSRNHDLSLERGKLEGDSLAASDFILNRPAGVAAGYPWFGEWGRDTFVSLPGLVAALADSPTLSASSAERVARWALDILSRWGKWIDTHGMLPNVLLADGPQWESADATLWWTHSLASLWAMGQANPKLAALGELPSRFEATLRVALERIRAGHHRHLAPASPGLIAVTTPHATWMDARVEGRAVTPRLGLLPEINALWTQANALFSIWNDRRPELYHAHATLSECFEADRPNNVFLHSLPLAPSFLARDLPSMERDAHLLATFFETPVGLRTLAPGARNYRARYDGGAFERDQAYHEGPAWGWLRGHYEMAQSRFARAGSPENIRDLSTIKGQFAELFDAEPPFTPRGAPAQAWSLACKSEAQARRAWGIDLLLREILEGAA